jgi:TPR repeat protein
LLYLHGRGTPVNKAKALECFKLSADAGFEPAKVALKRYAS